jgi:hypothetical protein
MIHAKPLVLASLVVLAVACAGSSAEAGRGPASAAPAVATPSPPAPAKVEEVQVICEYVKKSGSNIAVRECREVNHFVDEAGKKGAENWFRSKPSSPSR